MTASDEPGSSLWKSAVGRSRSYRTCTHDPKPRKLGVGDIERLRADTLDRLAKGGDVARATLREIFPDAIHLHPDDSGGEHLWAVFPCDEGALRVSLLYNTEGERLSALDAAVIAAFARSTEGTAQVGTNGSGGRI